MNTFQRDLDAAAERARRFFADARAAERRPGDLASAALSLSEDLISLAFRSERSGDAASEPSSVETAKRADDRPRLSVFSSQAPDDEPTILRFDAFRRRSRTEPRRTPSLKIFDGDAAERESAPVFPRLFVPRDERPRLRVVAAD